MSKLSPDAAMNSRDQQAAATRQKILESTISLIKEEGFGAASASRIARKSGMTWGAAQHHFGSKEAIFVEILRRSHDRFVELLEDPLLLEGHLYHRVELYVEQMRRHYLSDTYIAALGILLANRGAAALSTSQPIWEGKQLDETLQITAKIFQDCHLSHADLRRPLIMAHCMLSGLGIWGVLEQQSIDPGYLMERIKLNFYAMLRGM